MNKTRHTVSPEETLVPRLGPAKIPNPLASMETSDSEGFRFLDEESPRVLVNPYECSYREGEEAPPGFELAGPQKKIYFDPTKLKAAIVTCGGMCPGLNSLVRAIVLQLYYMYGVRNIVGVRYGLQGFIPAYGHDFVDLTPKVAQQIHGRGGSFLGMSRGPQPIEEVVDSLERQNIGMLFMIGGDGTLRAAQKIYKEITSRNLKISLITIPKTIDNDISFVDLTFGFQTAVDAATRAILGAHNEAEGSPHGIGLVKVMGRNAGFVAANATLALSEVNFCLVPEVPFDIQGPYGLMECLVHRVVDRGHAVIVVAEGAGQEHFDPNLLGRDASGNQKLGDIGTFLKQEIATYFHDKGLELNLKYIDPSYLVRSVPANSGDRIYTGSLGHHAVHAGMHGCTGMLVSMWNNHFVHVPNELAISHTKRISPTGGLWRSVLESTGQPGLRNRDKNK